MFYFRNKIDYSLFRELVGIGKRGGMIVYKIMSVGLEVYLFVRFLYIEKKIWVQGVVPAFFNLTLFWAVGSYFG